MSDNYASAYVGGGYALSKAGLYEVGWHVRAVNYGPYHYDAASRWLLPADQPRRAGQFAAALIGSHLRPGRPS